MSYLINRCKKIGVQIERISPMRYVTAPKNQPKKGQYSVDAEIKGRVIFDLLRAYKKLHQGEMQSFSLDWVAEKELGKSKVKIEQSKVWKDIPKLIEYNKFDVELSVMIDEKMRLIQHFNNLRLIAGCTWSSVWYNSFICDVLILREAKSRNILLPTKKKGVIKKEFTGAFVQKTTPGIHKNIILMDLQSLYPNIMRQFNVSFDTLDENGKYKINLIKSGGFFKANYISEPIGMIPSILTKLYDSRQKYKDKMKKYERGSMEWTAYDRLQFATKVLFNSLYGMLGYERFRLYNPIVAETVTLMGQHIIKWTKQKVEEFGFKVIYMDTDSIFVDARKNTLEEILEIEEKLNKFINDSYEELVKQFGCEKNTYLYMDFKCIYNKIFFTEAKKRYIGNIIYSDGKKLDKPEFEIKGFEMKKSNFSKFGKILSQKIFEMVLEGKTKIEVDEFIKNERKKIENNNEINMVSIPSSMKKNIWEYKTKSAVVRGAEFANDNLKEDFKAGSKMKFLYIKGTEKMPQTNVLCYSVDPPKGILVDWDKMFNNTIKNKINKIYEALGWGEFSDAESLMKWM
jgi:DNA polymerase I